MDRPVDDPKSFTKLQALLEKQGHVEEAEYAGYEMQGAYSEVQAIRTSNSDSAWVQRTAMWSGLIIH